MTKALISYIALQRFSVSLILTSLMEILCFTRGQREEKETLVQEETLKLLNRQCWFARSHCSRRRRIIRGTADSSCNLITFEPVSKNENARLFVRRWFQSAKSKKRYFILKRTLCKVKKFERKRLSDVFDSIGQVSLLTTEISDLGRSIYL